MAGSDNRLKTPIVRSLQNLAAQGAANAVTALAKAIPATVVSRSGQFVTVNFAMQVGGTGAPWTLVQADYPIGGSSGTDWYPFDSGTPGLLLPSDFYLGGVTGEGGGTADYSQRGNLSTLAFFPLPTMSGTPPGGDTDKRCVTGPNGAYVGTTDGSASVSVDKSAGITIKFGGKTWTFNGDGFTDSNSVVEETHVHQNDTGIGPPVNP